MTQEELLKRGFQRIGDTGYYEIALRAEGTSLLVHTGEIWIEYNDEDTDQSVGIGENYTLEQLDILLSVLK